VSVTYLEVNTLLALTRREQVSFGWDDDDDDDDICFVPDQHAELNLYIVSSFINNTEADMLLIPENVYQILNIMWQLVFVLTRKGCVLSEEKETNINIIVLDLTRNHTRQHNTLLRDSNEKTFMISRPIPMFERWYNKSELRASHKITNMFDIIN
jgi:hypothetical protein